MSKSIFFFDTETSGFIKKNISADHADQAWCIQIGGLLTDEEGNELEIFDMLIKPEGRDMHPIALATHGIELSYAQEHGMLERDVADAFGKIIRKADLIVCHNHAFDWGHATALLERNMDQLSDEARSAFYLDTPAFCTMKDPLIKKCIGAKNKAGRLKVPKLIEMYEYLFDKPFEGAHNALADITATKDCFFELIKRDVINYPYVGLEIDGALPDFEAEDIGCQCTELGLESEWYWNIKQGCYVCSGCGDVQ